MATTCGGTTGGRRRRSRKMRGGMGYGFGGAMGTNGPVWDSSWGGEITKAGTPVYGSADPQRGSSRRRRKIRGGERVEVLLLPKGQITDPAKDVPRYRAAGAFHVMERAEAEEKGYYIIGPAPSGSARRKSKKSRKSRRKTMRGGAPWQSVGPVRAEFAGSGSRGLADYVAGAAKVPPSGGPTQNPDGAYRP